MKQVGDGSKTEEECIPPCILGMFGWLIALVPLLIVVTAGGEGL